MSANRAASDCPIPIDVFTAEELTALATTADALSAYLGKAVLAEVGVNAEGREWVIFGMPLETQPDESEEKFETEAVLHVQIGGSGVRVLGNRGGLDDLNEMVYDCQFLWAIELRDPEEAGWRYVKLDNSGNEVDCSDDLPSLLPFSMVDAAPGDPDEEDEVENDEPNDGPPPVHIYPAPPQHH
jgi:hypothetical protein